jgi:hypothetical protein
MGSTIRLILLVTVSQMLHKNGWLTAAADLVCARILLLTNAIGTCARRDAAGCHASPADRGNDSGGVEVLASLCRHIRLLQRVMHRSILWLPEIIIYILFTDATNPEFLGCLTRPPVDSSTCML